MSKQAPRASPRLRRYVAVIAVAGVAVTVVSTAVSAARGELDQPLLLLAVAGAVTASSLLSVELPFGDRSLSMGLAEIGIILGFALLPAPAVVPAVVAGVLVVEAGRRLRTSQLLFNVGASAIAAGAAVLAVEAVGGGPIDVAEPVGLATMVLVALVYGLANLVTTALLVARLDDVAFAMLVRGLLLGSLAALGLSGSVGILVALLVATAPVALPLLVLPGWIVHRALVDRVARISADLDERDRLERTVEGASDGLALLDRQGVVLLANPAFRTRLGLEVGELVGQPLLSRLTELGADEEGLASLEQLTATLSPGAPERAVDLRLGDRVLAVPCTGLFAPLANRTGTVVLLLDVTEEREIEWLRRDFIARVSHELRTPLTAIIGFVETLHRRDAALNPAQRARYLEVVHRQSLRLDRLVTTLLWSARIERALEEAAARPVGIAATAREVLHNLPDLSAADVEVVGDAVALVDPDHLQQVLINLLVNADTYGRPPIVVSIRAQAADGTVLVEVSDGGDGVPAEFLPELFDPFAQASTGDRRTATGFGLGLAIVRSLVEENGGTIEYRRRDGRTCFQVHLPRADERASQPQPREPVGA